MNIQQSGYENMPTFGYAHDPVLTQVQTPDLSTAVEAFDILAAALHVAGIEPDQSAPAIQQSRGVKRKLSVDDDVHVFLDDDCLGGSCGHSTALYDVQTFGSGKRRRCEKGIVNTDVITTDLKEKSQCHIYGNHTETTEYHPTQLESHVSLAGTEIPEYFSEIADLSKFKLESPVSLACSEIPEYFSEIADFSKFKLESPVSLACTEIPDGKSEIVENYKTQLESPVSLVGTENAEDDSVHEADSVHGHIDYSTINVDDLFDGFMKDVMNHRSNICLVNEPDLDETSRSDEVLDTCSGYLRDLDQPVCLKNCQCMGYKTYRLKRMKRKSGFKVIQPLYKKLLKRRPLRTSNVSKFRCCAHACNFGWYSKRMSKFSVVRDYEDTDLHVYRFSWGTWKASHEEM